MSENIKELWICCWVEKLSDCETSSEECSRNKKGQCEIKD
jgi:hypothetical protein